MPFKGRRSGRQTWDLAAKGLISSEPATNGSASSSGSVTRGQPDRKHKQRFEKLGTRGHIGKLPLFIAPLNLIVLKIQLTMT